jgi:hypothetical protein
VISKNKTQYMKNAYLVLACLLIGTSSAFSQLKPDNVPVHAQQEIVVESSNDIPDAQSAPSNSSNAAITASRGGTGNLWEEDFGGGFPNGWVADDASGINPWKWSTNGSHGNFNNSQGANYDEPISSTTAANGFLINDPDSANQAAYGQPSGTTYQYLESYFATPEIDLGAAYPSLLLEFEQSFRLNNGVDMIVQVSTDSTNWTDYTVQGNVANNTGSDDPDLVSVNISGAVGTSETLFLRIGWSARVYFWMIDDMRIIEGLGNDLAMTDVWHGDIDNAFEYQQIPLTQAQEIVIGASCFNLGGTAQPNTIYTYDISDGNSSLDSGSFPANNTSIGSTAGDTTWYATGFVPATIADYTVTVTVASDSTDELLTNNEWESVFKMTDNIYAHDDEDNIELIVYGGDVDGTTTAAEFKMGLYYEMPASANLTAVQVAFGRLTTTTACIVEVFDASDLSNALVTEVYDILPGDVSTGNGVTILTNILIEDGDGFLLDAGVTYLISVGNTGEGEEMYLEASNGDDDRGQLRYGPYGAGNAIDWYTGWTTSPIIRGNFDAAVSVEENEDVSGVSIYPNPTTDNLNINFVSKEDQNVTINVIGVDGALVFSQNLTNKIGQASKTTVDFANLAKGIYMVQLVGSNSSLTQRVVVQ